MSLAMEEDLGTRGKDLGFGLSPSFPRIDYLLPTDLGARRICSAEQRDPEHRSSSDEPWESLVACLDLMPWDSCSVLNFQ